MSYTILTSLIFEYFVCRESRVTCHIYDILYYLYNLLTYIYQKIFATFEIYLILKGETPLGETLKKK